MNTEEKQARRVGCPKCGSPAGKRCVTTSYKPMSKSHSDRLWIGEDLKNQPVPEGTNQP